MADDDDHRRVGDNLAAEDELARADQAKIEELEDRLRKTTGDFYAMVAHRVGRVCADCLDDHATLGSLSHGLALGLARSLQSCGMKPEDVGEFVDEHAAAVKEYFAKIVAEAEAGHAPAPAAEPDLASVEPQGRA